MSLVAKLKTWSQQGRVSLVDQDSILTFKNLDERSDAIAHGLVKSLPEGKPVAIWGDKQHDMVSCMIGAIKAGHPYLVLPDH